MVQEGSYKERTLLIIDTLFQQLVAVFVLLIIWEVFKNYNFDNLHSWHIVLCTIGVGLCTAEGLLLFNTENSFLKDLNRAKRGTVHGVVMFIAFASLTTGVALKIHQKTRDGGEHFASTHSILGLIGWILSFVSVVIGVLTANAKRLPSLGQPALFKIIHLFFGVVAYLIGVVALGFGLHYLEFYTGTHGRNALLVFLSLYVAYSLIGSIKSCYTYFFG